MKIKDKKTSLATEIIKEQNNKLNIYKILSVILSIITISLLIILFLYRG